MVRKSEQEMIDESRRSGRQLATALLNGAEPRSVDVRVALQRGEYCVGQVPVHVYQYVTGDGVYVKKSGGWMIGGGLIGAAISAASITTNVVGNAARRAEAARDAAAHWEFAEQATVYLTSRRWSLSTATTWVDWWFNGIRASDCNGKMVTLELAGQPRVGLVMPHPDYWFVMFHKLAYDRVPMPPQPSDEIGPPGIGAA